MDLESEFKRIRRKEWMRDLDKTISFNRSIQRIEEQEDEIETYGLVVNFVCLILSVVILLLLNVGAIAYGQNPVEAIHHISCTLC